MTPSSLPPLRHKVLLGWVNDMSSIPRVGKRWPIIDIDEQTLQDYREYFPVIKQWGFDTIAIHGLFISHSWNPDLPNSVTLERRRAINELLAEAHKHDVRILAGLGVYSWGFEEIIRAHPEVAKNFGRFCWGAFRSDNGVAMCYSTEQAKGWQRKVIDFMAEFDIDGFEMQSADQGRCACPECRTMSEMEYHAAVNHEFATYIRAKWPHMTLGVSGWGMSFREDTDIPHLQKMSTSLDFITDVTDQSIDVVPPIRKDIIKALKCSFGSLGGTVVVPPQRWERLRWFLPHADLTGRHLTALAADGGSAYEFFVGPLVNPQYDLMTKYVGLLLNNPSLTPTEALTPVVEDTFAPRAETVTQALVQSLLELETLYFSKIKKVLGEFDFEPLQTEEAGPPVYLDRLTLEALQTYKQGLYRWRAGFIPLARETQKYDFSLKIMRCIDNVLLDVTERIETHSAS